jgi:translation initiation factor 1
VSTKKPDNPFAALADLKASLPTGPAPSAPPEKKGPPRAVVRLERKGRGGKEVTIVEKLALPPSQLEKWAKDLKQALGTGGAVDGDMIVLQGDVRPRVEALLRSRGVGKVTVG